MKFNTLGKAIKKLQEIGLDDIDIAILYHVDNNEEVTVGDILLDCGDVASPATLHSRLSKKLIKAKLLQLKASKEDGRNKFVVKGVKFDAMESKLGGL
jgi:hypothetical protein